MLKFGLLLFAFCYVAYGCRFDDRSGDFLDCIGDKIQDTLDDITPRYVASKQQELQGYFQAADCPMVLPLSADLKAFLKEYNLPTAIQEVSDDVANLFWDIARNQEFTECVLNDLRDRFLTYMSTCAQTDIPTGNDLDDVPTADVGKLPETRRYFETYIKAYVALEYCSSTQRPLIINKMSAQSDQDVCECAQENYAGDCKASYDATCPKIKGCVDNLITNFKTVKKTVFNEDEMKESLQVCYEKSGPGSLKLSNILAALLRIKSKFDQFNNDPVKTERYGQFISSVIKAHFKADFCEKCKIA